MKKSSDSIKSIGICALLVHPARTGGAETYARRFLSHLPQVDSKRKYDVFVAEGSDLDIVGDNITIHRLSAPVPNIYHRVLWEQTRLASILRSRRMQLVHFLGSTAPWNYRQSGVVAMHDTLRFQQPKLTPWLLGTYYSLIQYRNAKQGLWVLAGSNYAADIFRKNLPVSPRKVAVGSYGIDEEFFSPKKERAEKSYVLWAGQNYPHKNLAVLLGAYEILSKKRTDLPKLRIIGPSEADLRALREDVRRRGLSDFVEMLPRVSSTRWLEEFPKLYRHAIALCFPSLYESFGLPILEAMASGTAVIASAIPVHVELYSKHAVLVPPNDVIEWANAIATILDDVPRREAMESAGVAYAAEFTWRRVVERSIAIYDQIIEERDCSEVSR